MRVRRKDLIRIKKKRKQKLPSKIKLLFLQVSSSSKDHLHSFAFTILFLIGIVFVMAVLIESSRTHMVLSSLSYVNAHKPSLPVHATQGLMALESQEKYLLIYDPDNEESVRLYNNIKQTMKYIKKPLETVFASDFTEINRPYTSVIVALGNWDKIKGFSALLDYIEGGGNAFFAHKPEAGDAFYLIYRKIGIYEVGQSYLNQGIMLNSNVMLHSKGLQVEDKLIRNLSLMLRMDKKSIIHAKTPEGVPMLWHTDFGDGKLMIFNGTMLQWQINRGFFVGALSLLTEDFIYPVVNMKLAFLDQFPGPLPSGFNQQIYKEYGLSLEKFYREIWWQDLLHFMKLYDLKYTGAFLLPFEKKRENGMLEPAQQWAPLVLYGRELLNNGGEVGLNGVQGQTSKEMANSYKEANAVLKQVFPNYEFQTFVPRNNLLGNTEWETVQRTLPHIKIISSIYQERSQGDLYYGQEFTINQKGMAEIPRMTFGYKWTPSMQWGIVNGITSLGIYSHAITPLQTFDQENSWQSLSESYAKMLQILTNQFGWLRSMTASEAANELAAFEYADVAIQRKTNQIDIHVDKLPKDLYFIYRTKQNLTACQGCSYQIIDDGTYLIRAEESPFQIMWGDHP